jgi:hypothetical protein
MDEREFKIAIEWIKHLEKKKCELKPKIVLPSSRLEEVYWNHWTCTTEYPKVVLPCSHHSWIAKGPTYVNLVLHLESWRGKWFLPPNGQIGGDQNQKHVHECKAPHLSTKVQKESSWIVGILQGIDYWNSKQHLHQPLKRWRTIETLVNYLCLSLPRFCCTSFCYSFSN